MFNNKKQRVFDWVNDKLELPIFADAYKGTLVANGVRSHNAHTTDEGSE